MPIVCQFFGIVIKLYYNDHLPPHFHAEHGTSEALYEIETLRVYAGELPRRAHNMVLEWADQHRAELRAAWEQARQAQPVGRIAPLE